MTLKEIIASQMSELSKNDNIVFIGENIINSGRIYGTLNQVPLNKCLEMPVAENLIAGTAIGLAIRGIIPVVVFQRMDFMLIAADAIINHACLIPEMTGIKLPILFVTFKATLKDNFYAGLQHTKDLSYIFEPYMQVQQFPNYPIDLTILERALLCDQPKLLVIDHESLNNEVNLEKVG